ncbi:DUF4437 domain-containing protein [Porifericola rhodea]|uniref:DUF4437 domain-containing protein n=1 Tax=Porifericola rhodea TaxID=930972 RepID=UPI002665AB1B|nr:DUF4437 domain-containing protein [Porifericola rhodea]WKN29817.1 DUF4437 domain-containing protein [Porifericola rhodea]
MIFRNLLLSLILASIVSTCDPNKQSDNTSESHNITAVSHSLVLASDIKWEPLNPARGDQSPRAGTLWGDRNGSEPTGFLVKFAEGFSSPPHIHNITYKGVVIHGLIHNDDPTAENMWMASGSFWTQPAGEPHITAAKAEENMAFIEIEKGPYLVKPTDEAFDKGEKPINVDVSNLVWVDLAVKHATKQPAKVAYLWSKAKDDHLNGSLLKLPAGFKGEIQSSDSTFRAVVIQGHPLYRATKKEKAVALEAGSYFSSEGEFAHQLSTENDGESILYIRSRGKFELVEAQ